MEKSPNWVLMDLSESQPKPANMEEEAEKIEAEAKNNNNNKKAELEADYKNNSRAAAPPMPPAGAQLTIFYNGSVSIYDAVTPEKAQAIMLIAAATSAVSAAATAAVSANKVPVAVGANAAAAAANGVVAGTAAAADAALTRSLSQQSSSAAAAAGSPPQVLASPNASSLCKLQADLPIARRQSLQQFLEKRRSRLVSKAPYAPAKKAGEGMEVGVEGKPQVS